MLMLTDDQAGNLVMTLRGRGGLTDDELRRMLGYSDAQYHVLLREVLRRVTRKMVKMGALDEMATDRSR